MSRVHRKKEREPDRSLRFLAAVAAGLRELLAFSFLIGNEDLHAKNVSLLVEAERGVTRICDLAPPWLDRLDEIGFDDRQTRLMQDDMRARRDRLSGAAVS